MCVSVLLQEANVHNLSHRQGVTYLANLCVGSGVNVHCSLLDIEKKEKQEERSY